MSNKKADVAMSTEDETKDGKTEGFFQISSSRLEQISQDPDLGCAALKVYLVAAGGVDSKRKQPRACVHGPSAIQTRTSMSQGEIKTAIKELIKKDFLRSPLVAANVSGNITAQDEPISSRSSPQSDAEGKKTAKDHIPVQFQVDPDEDTDLALSQKFLQPRMVGKREGYRGQKGTLLKLLEDIIPIGEMQADEARLDAILVFLAFHRAQNFDTCAGIDPRFLHGRFTAIDEGDLGDGSCYQVPVNGVDDWTLVTMRKPTCPEVLDAGFIDSTLGGLEEVEGAPTLEERFRGAVENLLRCRLLYTAHVLWNGDPLHPTRGSKARPHYTLYLQDSWDEDHEDSLQIDIHKAGQATATISGVETYGASRGAEANYIRSGIFRFMVTNRQLKTATLLMQYRVRWWADDQDTRTCLRNDRKRISNWRSELKNLVERSKHGFRQNL